MVVAKLGRGRMILMKVGLKGEKHLTEVLAGDVCRDKPRRRLWDAVANFVKKL